MKRNFMNVRDFLEGQFPELKGKITGGSYPVPPILELLQNIVSMLQLGGMAWLVFGGQAIFRFLGFSEPPPLYHTITEYGTQIGIALFLLVPQLLNQFATNGAFEVVLDGERVIYSKLQEGRFPQADDLINPLVKLGMKAVS